MVLAEGTRLLLTSLFDTVVMVADECSLVEIAGRVRPGLLIIDLVLAKRELEQLISRVRESSPGAKVLVVSVHDERSVAEAVMEAGADAFLVRGCIGTKLVSTVEAVLRGERYPSPHSMEKTN